MRGATRRQAHPEADCHISIHAPHAGCDSSSQQIVIHPSVFQSTHPMRGATLRRLEVEPADDDFNPRTPCGVRHTSNKGQGGARCDFNPRTPCGVRPEARAYLNGQTNISIHAPHAGCDMFDYDASQDYSVFQSTHPMRGATIDIDDAALVAFDISIHAPHAGCDKMPTRASRRWKLFQSTHPMRGATS